MQQAKIIYFGTPQFAVESLKALLEANHEVCAVVTAPDRPMGRGLKVSQSAVKQFALERELPLLQPHSLKDPHFLDTIHSFNPNLFVVVAFRMMPKELWEIPKFGTFNLHASLLPLYRGAAPINHAIINGENETGVTTFFIDEKIDTGEIIFQEKCKITKEDNAGTLHDKLMHKGSKLVVKTVDALIKSETIPQPQTALAIDNELPLAPKLTKESGKIDWNRSSREINNLIRGLSPYPGSHSTLYNAEREMPVKLFSAIEEPESDNSSQSKIEQKPGDIESDNRTYLKVKCKTGSLLIESLQLAGKRRLEIKEFLAGLRDIKEYRFK